MSTKTQTLNFVTYSNPKKFHLKNAQKWCKHHHHHHCTTNLWGCLNPKWKKNMKVEFWISSLFILKKVLIKLRQNLKGVMQEVFVDFKYRDKKWHYWEELKEQQWKQCSNNESNVCIEADGLIWSEVKRECLEKNIVVNSFQYSSQVINFF